PWIEYKQDQNLQKLLGPRTTRINGNRLLVHKAYDIMRLNGKREIQNTFVNPLDLMKGCFNKEII
ncbi:MAG: hypothetical protein EBX50_19910, partial [Chitinophagia bacterium]|nr:hypothetical protein [Chitinophagia bacterium]